MLTDKMPFRIALIREVYDQPLSSYLGRIKLRQLLLSRYYWPGQGNDIDRYRANCYIYRRSHVPRDKTPRLLYPLPILDRLQQYITINFKKCPKSKNGYNIVVIFIDRLGKRPILILVRDTITARELALLFLTYIVQYIRIPESIISNRGLQFISNFQNEFYKYISIKLKLSTANYL